MSAVDTLSAKAWVAHWEGKWVWYVEPYRVVGEAVCHCFVALERIALGAQSSIAR